MAKPNPFVKAWKYFMSWFGAKVDEKADPKIQIQQAIQEAQNQHAQLTRQAATVIVAEIYSRFALLFPAGHRPKT